MKLLQFPIIKIIPWFLLGIVGAYYFSFPVFILITLLIFSVSILGFQFYNANNNFNSKSHFGIGLSFVFFFLGIVITELHKENLYKNHYTHFLKSDSQKLKGLISEKLKNTTKYNRYLIKVSHIDNKKAFGKIILNIKKENFQQNLIVGQQILLYENVILNLKANNPNQFDYSRYLISKNIFGQIYSEGYNIKILPEVIKDYNYYVFIFRNTIIENLRKSGFGNHELAVITALILGQQQEISKEILQDYQYAGAVHILSVSGLHVGFILLFITLLLKPIPSSKIGNIIKLLLTILGLWLFALIAGLAPSVVRSTVMFSFLAIGMSLNRETNKYYTVVVSMFLILLFEPMFLFDIGFQLSYAAVFALLWTQPLLAKTWQPKNLFLKYSWNIMTVSVAAQIGTLPLSIYYFHQFPSLFFVTNLILIPILEFVIMPLGVILMFLAYFNWTPIWFSQSIEFSIMAMNTCINWIASVESLIIKDIPLSFLLMLISYFVLIQFFIWFQKPRFKNFSLVLIGIIIFQITFIYNDYIINNKSEFIVFNSFRKTIIGEKRGKQITIKSNDFISDNSFEKNMLSVYATANFGKLDYTSNLLNTLYFNQKKILVIDKSSIYYPTFNPDVIILTHSPKINLDRVLETARPKIIVADASNFKNYVAIWKITCKKRKIPFHSTYEKGFYSVKQ